MLESGREFNKLKDITEFFNINFTQQRYSYNLVIFNEIQKKKKTAKIIRQEDLKKYVFIIDEINRGEISKISESCSLLLIQDTEVWQERFPPSMQIFMLIAMKNSIFQIMFISLVR